MRSLEDFGHFINSTAAPIATGRSDHYRVGACRQRTGKYGPDG